MTINMLRIATISRAIAEDKVRQLCRTAKASGQIKPMRWCGKRSLLACNPADLTALTLKGNLYGLHGRYEESLLIIDGVLAHEPENSEAIEARPGAETPLRT
jgi:hypothetical protein